MQGMDKVSVIKSFKYYKSDRHSKLDLNKDLDD